MLLFTGIYISFFLGNTLILSQNESNKILLLIHFPHNCKLYDFLIPEYNDKIGIPPFCIKMYKAVQNHPFLCYSMTYHAKQKWNGSRNPEFVVF